MQKYYRLFNVLASEPFLVPQGMDKERITSSERQLRKGGCQHDSKHDIGIRKHNLKSNMCLCSLDRESVLREKSIAFDL